jgi:leucine dehydrogenase
VLECREPATGYHAFVVIHSTVRGPAIGGIRRRSYPDRIAALADAAALARGMSYKSALADLPFGGGKSVIAEAAGTSRHALYRMHALVLEKLSGRYIGAQDLGTTRDDVADMREVTGFLAGLTDPAPWTARGVRRGIEAAAMHRWQSADLHGCRVALQGCGAVGYHLARELHNAGAILIAADPDPVRLHCVVTEFDAVAVEPDRILHIEADVFAPCAVGAILDADSITRLKVAVVAGAANNQLCDDDDDARDLDDRGILFVPDYLINVGGLMTAGVDLLGWPLVELERRVDDVYARTLRILDAAAHASVPPLAIADATAAERLRVPAPVYVGRRHRPT